MGTPLGDFVRARRDRTQSAVLGLPERGRRRSPGVRRTDLAVRAGISVEYLTRIEQGRDRNPSIAVVNALADALSLSASERDHLRYLAKISGGECTADVRSTPADRRVRPSVLATLHLLEPGLAIVTNRLGDLFAWTDAFGTAAAGTGLLDADEPNLTRFVFTDPRARALFPDWEAVADERAFDLWLAPTVEHAEWLSGELAASAGPEFTARRNRHLVPPRDVLTLAHPGGHTLRLTRQEMELSAEAQQLLVLHPADDATAQVLGELLRPRRGGLRSIS
ncbi:helix-turn-helix domain-containing protein [Streptomyces sp. NPDC060194]|uniref:helix-turn-helix domain-containing protein n=1 Tax=Streptomyces sp. NPDC060194 TaxID=3347069 RepID=UPI00364C59E0